MARTKRHHIPGYIWHIARLSGMLMLNGQQFIVAATDAYDPDAKLSLDFAASRSYMPANIHQGLFGRVQHHGTHESYISLLARKAELVIAAREPSEDELVVAGRKGVRIRFTPVALDAFVFIVNRNNPVGDLTVNQIRAIYTGTIANWSEVGGVAEAINPYQRNRNSGSQEMMEKLVMKGQKMIQPRDLEVPLAMIGPFNAIRDDRKGIGYTMQYYDTHMTRIAEVKTVAVDGIVPSAENIRARTYPFVPEVFVAWLDELPQGTPARTVRDWLLSNEGQRLVGESGYIPIK
jgi:phosphate transport system substrate-binding protein